VCSVWVTACLFSILASLKLRRVDDNVDATKAELRQPPACLILMLALVHIDTPERFERNSLRI
jgi:hypothetical protein